MEQIFEHYENWEDFKNGMWRKVNKQDENKYLNDAIVFMSDHIQFGKAMQRVINEWPVTCRHNLTDTATNRQAFMGQTACSIAINCPEYITRLAWGYLSNLQREKANGVADTAIRMWEYEHRKLILENTRSIQQMSMF